MSNNQQEEARIREVYERRKALPQSQLYSALVPSALFIAQTRERALLKILSKFVHKPLAGCRVLDAGCGDGHELARLVPYGFQPERLYGVELLEERVERAQATHPQFQIAQGNAAEMPWADGHFDIVIQYMMFSSILDDGVLQRAATEMLRVLAPGGIIISYDMRVTRPDNPDVRPIRKKDVRQLWPGLPIHFFRTTLLPPLARLLASRSWTLCELLHILPPLRSHYMAVVLKSV